jgi:hypothetical protein
VHVSSRGANAQVRRDVFVAPLTRGHGAAQSKLAQTA